jgi:serine/threonine protein kinase/tetratricopeptide (TPR) repeat protein
MNDRIDTSQWQRLGVLFEQAIGLDAMEQAELLGSIEQEDAELAKALASLLAADALRHERTIEHRERVLQGSLDAMEGPDVVVGDRVGSFILCEELGRGGMGVVFRAERADGQVRQEVALKVIKLGMDTREVIARFEADRQALALMDHPHIARMLDAGATDSGRPYFVMELVRGEPISSYCSERNLSIVQRLQLFDQVCAAVQHAHTKGIIHRDLKPNNVLVITQDDQPFGKVIDFGIAKATSGRLTEKTLLTERFLMMGAPLYMSPEQAAGSADIDTRTDIYALGVILYELLTDSTPIDSNSLRTAAHAEVQRIIREVDPPRPSARLSQSIKSNPGAAARHGIDPRVLERTVRGELDWIVMKAIENDRTRRYETANAFALDVQRYLAGEAVLAAPPGAVYRLRKLVQRNKGAVAAGALIAAALLAGMVAFAWQARIAQARANELEQVSKFQEAMLGQVDPTEAGRMLSEDVQSKFVASLVKAGVPEAARAARAVAFDAEWKGINATDTASDLINRTILKPAVAAIDKRFRNQPVVAATLDQVLADRYVAMGLYDAAMPLQQSALATRRRVLGEDNPDTLQSISALGELLQDEGKLSAAEPFLREALENRRSVLGEEHPDTLESMVDMGEFLKGQGKMSEAEPYLQEALRTSRRVNGEEGKQTLALIGEIGVLLQNEGKLSESEFYLREAAAKMPLVMGEDNPDALALNDALAWTLLKQGKMAEAEPYARLALEKSRRNLGEEHPGTLYAVYTMGNILYDEGKLSEAEPYFREALEKRRRVLGGEQSDTLESMLDLGGLLTDEGKLSEAEPILREAMETSRRVLGDQDPTTLYAIDSMGILLQQQGKLSEAESYLREALEKALRAQGEHGPSTEAAIGRMGALLIAQQKYTDAEKLLAPFEAEARNASTGYFASSHAAMLMGLGKARAGLGEFASAETDLLAAQAAFKRVNLNGARKCIQAIVDLYRAWNVVKPGKGYDAEAAEWKQKLAALGAPIPVRVPVIPTS